MAAHDVKANAITTSSLAYADSRDHQRHVSSPMGSANSSSWKELHDGSAGGGGIVRPITTDDTKNDPLGDIELLSGGDHSLAGDGAPGRADGEAETGRGAAELTVTYKVYRRRWFGLVQLVLMNIIVSWDWLTYSPVSSDAAAYFNTTENTINWLSTAFLFAFVVICPATIYVLHRGPKPAIITASVLILVGNWARYGGTKGNSFGAVMFGQILTGLAQPFVLSAPALYSDLWFTNRGRVAATAIASLANPFGAALGQLIVPFWVGGPGDIPNMVLYVAIISTVASVPSFFIPKAPPTPSSASGETPKMGVLASVGVLARSVEFWLIFVPFAVYVGFFNSVSSLLNQILEPYGFSDNEAGIAGALLIFVGLVTSAVSSPIIDRTKKYVLLIKVAGPSIGLCYLVFVWMPETRNLAGPYVVLAVLGAASFALLPVAVELLVEVTHPVSPEVTSTLAWAGGQLLGGCFILISDALKAGSGGDPPGNLKRGLVFTAVIAMVALVPPMCLGWFGRADKVQLRRVDSDDRAADRQGQGH